MISDALLSPQAAWARIDAHLHPLDAESVARHAAIGRVLAAPLAATVDMPQADVSAMDGYVLAGEVPTGDPQLVIGIASAGPPPTFRLAPGQVAKIMTGAVVPDGGDRVIPIEQTDGGADRVTLRAPAPAGAHIRRQAEVVATGDPMLSAGARLTAGTVSQLASHGYGTVDVVRRPAVSCMATGDEVVPPDEVPSAGKLRDSNTSFLLAALGGLGLEGHSLGIAPDDRSALERRISAGMAHDVLLLTGGVSMGDFDYVEDQLTTLGCEVLVDAVAIQPGKPLVVARHPHGWVIGLPGNPASVMVTFWLFVRPLLRRMMGLDDAYGRGWLEGVLDAPLPGAKGRDRFLPASVVFDAGRLRVTPHPPRGSHDVHGYGTGSALVRIPARAIPAEPGAYCTVVPLVDWLE